MMKPLLEFFADLNVDLQSLTVTRGAAYAFARTDAEVLLVAKKLGVTPESRADGRLRWICADGRIDGAMVTVHGPQTRMP